ncbi:MAG: DUF3143 domain-containing protein [Cyanobacteriota bacterium]|jgi:hypothetical protein
MALPPAQTPLYNHPLPQIEAWLTGLGGLRLQEPAHGWRLDGRDWTAQLYLETEEVVVCYFPETQTVSRSFKYSLSREDIEAAILAGP